MFFTLGLRHNVRARPNGLMLMPNQINLGCLIGCRCKSSRNSFESFRNVVQVESRTSNKLARHNQPESSLGLLKPTLFALTFSSASFIGASIWQYENMRSRARELMRSPQKWMVDKLNPHNSWIREKLNERLRIRVEKHGSFRQLFNTIWNSLSEAQKIFLPILCVNVLVYLGWKVPSLRPTMMMYFTSNPTKPICWPMFLSTFSHMSIFHLMANMFVLNSFITGIVPSLGKEQFIAFYFSAGTIASLFSHFYKVAITDMRVSVGASGAIMGVLSYNCIKYPDTLLSVIFIPFVVFKASTGIKAMMAVDFTGMLMKFKILDHAAHFGGALFGIFWCLWGNELIWQNRGPLLEKWHQLRKKSETKS